LVDAIRAHHESHPLAGGLPREEARERLFRRAAPEVFQAVMVDLVAARRIVARDRLTLEGRQVSLSDEEARVQAALERVYRDARLTPPDIAIASLPRNPSVAERIVSLLVRNRTLVRVESLVFASALDDLNADVRRLKAEARRRSRRRVVQGAIRRDAEICDSAAGVSRSGARDEANGGEPDRALARHDRGGTVGRPSGLRGRPASLP
jgi:hypothetical protein